MGEVSSPGDTVVEASPLISFLKVDRFDILEALYPTLLCTEHVSGEVVLFHQRERLLALLERGRLQEVSLTQPAHLAEFAHLTEESPLGPGEASSLLYAAHYGCRLIITDKKGIREAKKRGVVCVTTQEVMVTAIRSSVISLADADALIETWKSLNEFPVIVSSFAPLISLETKTGTS